MKAFFQTKKASELEDGTSFKRNGGMVLEKLIGFCNGKCNPICCFSAEELKIATNNYEERQVLFEYEWSKLYKGFLQDRPILVKKYEDSLRLHSLAINEIPFASYMSVHKNVLKLIGCCLETEIPILVFESVKHGNLLDHLYSPNAHFQPLLWKHRLKIAVDIANVVAYFHNAFPKPIIHRDIKPSNILLDEHYVAKLTDFSLSIPIPDGESHVEDLEVVGTIGFLAPEYYTTRCINEKYDVFSFGVCLLVLLAGKKACDFFRFDTGNEACFNTLVDCVKKYIEEDRFNEIVDQIILEEGPWPGKNQELQSFVSLALRCTCETTDNRPTMIDVAKELRQLYRSGISPI